MTNRSRYGTGLLLALGACVAFVPAQSHASDEAAKAFYAKKCEVCHSIGGKGGKMANIGGSLDGVGSKRTSEWLHSYLQNPKKEMPEAKMPAVKMTDEERDQLVNYLLTLK